MAYTIALQERERKNLLFIVPEFFGATKIAHLIEEGNTPFEKVILLRGVPGQNSSFGKLIERMWNVRFLAQFLAKEKITNVFIGNDARPEAQVILSYSKQKNSSCKGVYMNDGAAAYMLYAREKSVVRYWIGKIFFGWWWQDVTVLGTSPWINEIRAIFPELVRPELQDIPRVSIQKEDFLKLKEESWVLEYMLIAGISPADLENVQGFVILPHSAMLRKYPQCKEVFEKIFSWSTENKIAIATKFHPNEPSEELFLVPKEGVLLIPKAIPFEFLYLFCEKPPSFLLGDVSTSLLTGRWIFKDIKIFSIAPLFSYFDSYLFKVFSRLNIKVVDSLEEFEGLD